MRYLVVVALLAVVGCGSMDEENPPVGRGSALTACPTPLPATFVMQPCGDTDWDHVVCSVDYQYGAHNAPDYADCYIVDPLSQAHADCVATCP